MCQTSVKSSHSRPQNEETDAKVTLLLATVSASDVREVISSTVRGTQILKDVSG